MRLTLLGAIGSLVLWGVLAFVMAIPSGWAHLPLAVGVVLLAKVIIDTRPAGDS